MSLYSIFYYKIASVFNVVPCKGPKITSVQYLIFCLISLKSLNHIMAPRWWNFQILCNFILQQELFIHLHSFLKKIFLKESDFDAESLSKLLVSLTLLY